MRSLEDWASPVYQESYDNSGLQIGDPRQEVENILLCLDFTEEVLSEAITRKCQLVIAHHPLIFKGLKRISPENAQGRMLLLAAQKGIALYALHTNLDNIQGGVNAMMAERLGLETAQVLSPKPQTLGKLITFVPSGHLNTLSEALFQAGAGKIGPYSHCSFYQKGTGTFLPENGSNPYSGQKGKLSHEQEERLEVIYPLALEARIIKALRTHHPYETPAFDCIVLNNHHPEIGSGQIGHLPQEMDKDQFLQFLRERFHSPAIRFNAEFAGKIKKVAVCGGSGSFLIAAALKAGADALVTADVKYHNFFEPGSHLLVADIGHYESEVYVKEWIARFLTEKFRNIAVHLCETDTNAVSYF